MSDYKHEYQDKNGKHTRVVGSGSRVLLQFFDPEQAYSGVAKEARVIPAEDAPEIALAILEAARVEIITEGEGLNPAMYLSAERHAVTALKVWKKHRDAREAREAEDAKVREWYKTVWPGGRTNEHWDVSDEERRAYRAAHKFFTEGA